MYFGIHLLILLLSPACLTVALSEALLNESSSGDKNISVFEIKTLPEEVIRLNITSDNENNFQNPQFVQHESKKKNKKHKTTRKINQLQMVNSTIEGEESTDNAQVRSLKRSIDTLTTRKIGIREKPQCEAMVLTYGPIGFKSALELISNANRERKQSYSMSDNSGGNARDKLKTRMLIGKPTVITRMPAMNSDIDQHPINYMSEEEYINSNDNEALKRPEHEQIRIKKSVETNIGENNAFSSKEFEYSGHGIENVVDSNKLNARANKLVQNDMSKKDQTVLINQENQGTYNKDKYSTLIQLQKKLPGFNLHARKESKNNLNQEHNMQTGNSVSTKELFDQKKLFQLQEMLTEAEYAFNESLTLDKSADIGKNDKPCPKQPKFIDKITIDRGNYNLNQNIPKHCGIDKKHPKEHFIAKTSRLRTPFEEQISAFNGKTKGKENYNEEKGYLPVLEKNFDVDRNTNVDNQQKSVHKRYIPELHPMPETEDDKRIKESLSEAYLKLSGGSSRFQGKTKDELRKELIGLFNTWERGPGQRPSDNKNKQVSNIKLDVPVRFCKQPSCDDIFPGNLEPENVYDQTAQDPHLEKSGAVVYSYDSVPNQLESDSPVHSTFYQEVCDDNCRPLEQYYGDQQTVDIERINEANYYPIDYQYLLPQSEYQQRLVAYETDLKEAIQQELKKDYVIYYQDAKSKSVEKPMYQTNVQYSNSDVLGDAQPKVSVLNDIVGDKDNSNIKIMKVRFKPSECSGTNKNQKRKSSFYKKALSVHNRKKKSKGKRNYL